MGDKGNQRIMVITCSLMIIVSVMLFNLVMVLYSTQQYQQAQKLIEEQKWQQANQVLKDIPDYKDSEQLKTFVEAQLALQESQQGNPNTDSLQKATKFVAAIPMDYEGPFADEIRALRTQLQVAQQN